MASNSLKLYLFYCSNNFNIDEFNRMFFEENGDNHKIISLPCAGKADILYFLKAFEKGADGLILVTCSKSECRFVEGGMRAPNRAEKVNKILDEIGMGRERITVIKVNGEGMGSIVTKVQEFRNKIRGLATNTGRQEKNLSGGANGKQN